MSISAQLSEPRHVKAGSTVVSNPSSVYNKKQKESLHYVLPRSAPSATSLSTGGSQIIFDLPSTAVDQLDMMYLCFTIRNNNGAAGALHPVDGWTMIDQVEVQNRGVPVQSIYGQALRKLMILTLLQEKAAMTLRAANMNPTTYVPLNTIADAASLTYRVALPTVLNTAQVPLWREENQWRIVITMRGGTDVVLSTTVATPAQIGLSEVQLLLDGIQFEENVRAAFDRELESAGDIHYKYLEGTRDPLSLGTTVSGTIVQQNYQQTGNLAFAFLDLRSTVGTNQTQYTPLPLNTAELLQNGRVVSHSLGDNAYTYDVSRLQAATHWPNPLILDVLNTFVISFSDDPASAITTGASHGHYRCNGNAEIVRVTPGNSGANNLWVFGFWHSYFRVNYATRQIRIERKPLDY